MVFKFSLIIGLLTLLPSKYEFISLLEPRVYDEFVIQGNIAVFRCQIPDHLKDTVRVKSWYLSNGIILKPPENRDKFTALPSGELLVRSVDTEDSYLKVRCEVKNDKTGRTGITSTPGKLTVIEAKNPSSPKIFFQLPQISAREGDHSVYLPCIASGYPLVKYEWFQRISDRSSDEYVPLVNLNRPSSRYSTSDGLLIITEPKSSDSNEYRCISSNNLGRVKCEIRLTVYSPLRLTLTTSPTLVPVSQSSTKVSAVVGSPSVTRLPISLGSSLSLNCTVKGFPVKNVKWTKEGKTLLESSLPLATLKPMKSSSSLPAQPDYRHYQQPNSHHSLVLDLLSLERKHEGFYICLASNDLGSTQQTIQLFFDDEEPIFTETFTDQLLSPGASLSLICSARGRPLPQVTWTLDHEPIKSSHRTRYADYVSQRDKVTSYVNVSSIRTEDSGLYQCIASNTAGKVTHSRRINVYGEPGIKPLENRTALEGDNVWFYCPVYGYPYGEVSWLKDDEMVPSNGRQEVFTNGSLLVKNVNRKVDEGYYTCQLSHFKGSEYKKHQTHQQISSKSFLKIMVGPRIDPFAFPKDMEEGMRNVAFCTVSSGDGPIYIDWYKNGVKLDSNGFGTRIEMLNSFTSTITFQSLTTQHTGNYTCLASNSAASVNFTAEMIVKVSPTWIKEPVDLEVINGAKVILDCQAAGFPEPQIRWKKEELDSNEAKATFKTIISNPHMHILENGSLFISSIGSSDSGKYMCQATNGVNPALSKVINVKSHSPPIFDSTFVSKIVKKGDSLSLSCNASGDEPIVYQWKKDDIDLDQLMIGGRYRLDENKKSSQENFASNSILAIGVVDRSDSALFTCTSTNSYGSAEKTFRLIVQEPPETPINLNLNEIKSDSVLLTWSEPYNGNSPIIEYIVQYRSTGSSGWSSKVSESRDSSLSTSLTLENLKATTNYEIRVIAKNALGSSEPSQQITLVTLEKEPVFPPQDVRIIPRGSSVLKVSWSPPKPPEGDKEPRITGYHIAYRKAASDSPYFIKTLEVAPNKVNGREEYLIGGLERLTRYEVKVQGYNMAGDGPFSDPLAAETLQYDAPKAPIVTILGSTPMTIDLSWEPTGDEPVTGYLVFYRAEAKEWISQQVSSITSYTIYSAQCGTRYQIYVLGINDAGQGDHSDTVIARTEGTAPVAPDKSSFLQSNSTFVLLNLHSWHSNGCPILYFDIQYKRHGDREWLSSSTGVPVNSSPYLITDLSPATWYNLLMKAVNEAGSTDAEYVFATLTLDGTLIPPLSVINELENEPANKLTFTSKWVVQQLNLILPILCGLGVLTLGLIVICSLQMRKSFIGNHSDPDGLSTSAGLGESVYKIDNTANNDHLGSPITSSGNHYKTETISTEVRSTCDPTLTVNITGGGLGAGLGSCRQTVASSNAAATSIYYPSPYALSRIEEYRTQEYGNKCDETYKLSRLARPPGQITSYHDYDTPIFLKRVNLNSVSPSLE